MKLDHLFPKLMERVTIDTNGCWIYNGPKSRGYGIFCGFKVHRLVYELQVGPIPDGMFVCHKCDVKECCNPKHLFVGTPRDNVIDHVNKGLKKPGPGRVKGTSVRLTEDTVRRIRIEIAKGRTNVDIGQQFFVSDVTISKIKHGKAWEHVI